MTHRNGKGTRVADKTARRARANKAIARMRDWNERELIACPKHNTRFKGMCAHAAACAYGLPAAYHDSAIAMWNAVPAKYRHTGKHAGDPPRGAIVFWLDDKPGDRYNRHGHTGIANGRGRFWGVDLPRDKVVGHSRLALPNEHWGMPYAGWVWPEHIPGWHGIT